MPDNEWDQMLAVSTAEVLETMFFTDIRGPAQPGLSLAGSHFAAHLSFEGTPSGALTLCISEQVTRSLADGFLASGDDDELTAAQLQSVVCELANMICGTLLSNVKTEQHFRLSTPESMQLGAGLPIGLPSQSLSLDEGAIDLWLALEDHAH